jgi:ABC-type glutathione transport system ATPase component
VDEWEVAAYTRTPVASGRDAAQLGTFRGADDIGPLPFGAATKRFGGATAVDGLDLEVRPGEISGFLGPNGTGKTTTIRMLTGLLRPTAGCALICGPDVQPTRYCKFPAKT